MWFLLDKCLFYRQNTLRDQASAGEETQRGTLQAELEWLTCLAYKCFPKAHVQIGVDEILSLSMISTDKYTVIEFCTK